MSDVSRRAEIMHLIADTPKAGKAEPWPDVADAILRYIDAYTADLTARLASAKLEAAQWEQDALARAKELREFNEDAEILEKSVDALIAERDTLKAAIEQARQALEEIASYSSSVTAEEYADDAQHYQFIARTALTSAAGGRRE